MKKIKFFAMALAALAMFSCSKDEVNGGGAGEAEAIGTPTYATFSFKTGAAASAASRAGSVAETDEGKGAADDIASEKVIKTARLLIFSTGPGNLLETNKLVTLTGTGTTKFTEVVKAGDKKMYVIANESAAMKTALDGLVVGTAANKDFLALTYKASTTADPSTDGAFTLAPLYNKTVDMGFPMSSSDARTYKFIAKIDQAVAEGGTTEATNSFSIPLDFMLAKVSVVAKDAGVLNNATYKISNMKFAIRNIAKETFLTQQFDAAGVVKGMYYDFVPTPATSQDGWKPNYHYSAVPSVAVATTTATEFVYATENTKSTATLLAGGSTYAAISCIITPQSSYAGAGMKWDAINSKLALGTAAPIADPTGTGDAAVGTTFIVKQQTTGTYSSIAAGTVFPTLKDLQIAYFIQTNSRDYVEATDNANLPVIDAADYKTYTGGVAWYRINISKTDGTKPVYGVERGLQYTATINSISGIGLVGDDLAPETPLDQNTYISATITAKGWTAAGSSTDL